MPYSEEDRADAELPGLGHALWRALRFAYRSEPKLLVVSFSLIISSWIPDALIAFWLKLLANGVTAHNAGRIRSASIGLAVLVTAGWILRTYGGRIESIFRERATIAIEAHVANLQASIVGIEHHERPAYLDRLQLLRDQAFLLNHLYMSFTATVGSVGRLAITVALLMSIHPVLALLALFAVPTVVVASKRASVERATEERARQFRQRSRHLLDLGTMAGPAKEVRVSNTGELLIARRRAAWEEWWAPVMRQRWRSAAAHSAAWTLFGFAYVGAVVYVSEVLHASPANVLLALAAGAGLARYLGVTVGQAEFLRWTIDAAQRLAWLEDYAATHAQAVARPAPARLERAIQLEHVSFTYPGTDREVLHDVDLSLPARSVVAIVGENGAGKTTLVKLLCRMYGPTSGRILVDDVDLAEIPAPEWRTRLSGAFQDFFRYEFLASQTVGLGDLARIDDLDALEAAIARAGADDVVERLPRGLESQLGPTWTDGVELSFGQWQKLALARGLMRDDPLLIILDEPTAALDAETEHALFEKFASAGRAGQHSGRITVLVSHRFSTVRMADLILVINDSRVVEAGSHAELMARRGLYAELYGIQAKAYR